MASRLSAVKARWLETRRAPIVCSRRVGSSGLQSDFYLRTGPERPLVGVLDPPKSHQRKHEIVERERSFGVAHGDVDVMNRPE
jgi:hypothetical protein